MHIADGLMNIMLDITDMNGIYTSREKLRYRVFFCKRQYSRKLCIGEYYIEISKFAICMVKFFLRKTGNSCSNENVKYVNCVLAKL